MNLTYISLHDNQKDVICDMIQHLYIFQMAHTGAIKIGRSSDVERRRKQIQTGCPYEIKTIFILDGQGKLEPKLHKMLNEYRTAHFRGEWFREGGLTELPQWIYNQLNLEIINTWWERNKELPGPGRNV